MKHLDKPVLIHICKDKTLSYRRKHQPVFNKVALPVFSVHNEYEAEQLLLAVGRRQYTTHPLMPDQPWFKITLAGPLDFKTLLDMEDLPAVEAKLLAAYNRVKERQVIVDYYSFSINRRLDAIILDGPSERLLAAIYKRDVGCYQLYGISPDVTFLERAIRDNEAMASFATEPEARAAALGYVIALATITGDTDPADENAPELKDIIKSFAQGVQEAVDSVGPGGPNVMEPWNRSVS